MDERMKELEQKVIAWAEEREIFAKATALDQHNKTVEEVLELRDALVKAKCLNLYSGDPNSELYQILESTVCDEVKDGIGDTLVTLILTAKRFDFTLEECLEHAYNEIKDRKGKMINGVFVKE